MSGPTQYRTPPEEFLPLWQEFHFNVDAAASDENTLVKECNCLCGPGEWCDLDDKPVGRYYTAETDGTKRGHYGPGDVVWCNPPYSPGGLVDAFVETAAVTAKEQGALWVMLLNSSMTETARWHNHIWDRELHRFRERGEVRYPDHRWKFLRPDGKPSVPRYSNMLVIFRPPLVSK